MTSTPPDRLPKITVVTALLNQAQFIEAAMQSVLSQGYPNLEYIVIDGGSTDGSVEIIRRYADRLHYWVSEPDQGMYDAINKGFQKSSGEIMLWLNSDDLLHPFALSNIATIFQEFKEVQWLTAINTAFDQDGRVIAAHPAKNFSKYDLLLDNFQWIQQESTAWRRTLWERAGSTLETGSRYAGDLELWLRYMMMEKLYRCEVLIGGFRFREGQLSRAQVDKYLTEAHHYTLTQRQKLNATDRRNLFILKSIRVVRKLLRYSILLDWVIFGRLLGRIERNIHGYPTMIRVNRTTFKFEKS
jgi:glycosyltransferase involved in cell wall biosynthesis